MPRTAGRQARATWPAVVGWAWFSGAHVPFVDLNRKEDWKGVEEEGIRIGDPV